MPPPLMHDALFKAAFGQPEIAESELALLLPPDVLAHLDLATLAVTPGSFVDEDLRHAHTDLLYTLRTRDGHSPRAPRVLVLALARAPLSARGLECSQDTRSKLADCSDTSRLTRWLARAATAFSEADVFADADS